MHITHSEYEILELLSEQWDVPVATAAYGLLADSIAKCRGKNRSKNIPDDLVYAASRIMAKYSTRASE